MLPEASNLVRNLPVLTARYHAAALLLPGLAFAEDIETANQASTTLYAMPFALALAVLVPLFVFIHLWAMKQRTGKLADTQARLLATLDALPDLMFEIDLEGRFHDYHSPRSELLAAPPDVFIGKTIAEILPAEVAKICMDALRQAHEHGHATAAYSLHLPHGLHWFDLSIATKPSAKSALPRFIALSRDVTASKLNEQKLQRQAKLYAAFSQCSQSVLHCRHEGDLYQQICEDAVVIGGIKMAWIGIADPDTHCIKPVAAFGSGLEYVNQISIPLEADSAGPTLSAFRNNQPYWIEDWQNDPITLPWRETGARFGWKSSAALPIRKRGQVVGAINLYSEQPNAFDEDERALLLEIASDIESALLNMDNESQRAESQAALQQQLKFAHALNEISREVAEQDDYLPILNTIVRTVGETLSIDRVLIYDVSFSRNEVAGQCEWLNPAQPGIKSTIATYPLNAFISGATEMRTTRHYLTSHVDHIHPLLAKDGSGQVLHQHMQIRQLLWYPFAFREDGYYLLVLNQVYSDREWHEEELTFLESINRHVNIALRKKELQLKDRRQTETLRKLSQAVEQSSNSIIITDLDANIEYVNTAFLETTGYSFAEVVGKNPNLLQSGKTEKSEYADLWRHLSRGESWKGEFINKRKDGSEYYGAARIRPIRQEDGTITHYLAIEEDISEQKQTEERINYLAHFDVLTGLPNRTQLEDHLRYALNLAKRSTGHAALLFFDVDHFKDINDNLGHSIGDALLVELSQRLRLSLRDEDTISRLGGDEFILILPGTDARGAAQVAQKLLDVAAQPYHIEEYDLHVSASVGIALYPNDGTDIGTLSKNADTAMYRAKQAGRNGYCFFTREMQTQSARHMQLLSALRHALELNQLELHYQPQFNAHDKRVIGAEALLRWKHPELGYISPVEFIPVAEESGLILPIGEWVLRAATSQAKRWMEQGRPPLIMAVNLSAVQFRHRDLPDLITSILDEAGLPPEYLELELTESVAMHNPHEGIAMMNALHERGIRMSIDDFGTGYSSLSYIKKFRVYKLKIDQSFVRDISVDAEDKAIVGAIIRMAQSLGLQTIAEGVETASQLAYLSEQGCNEVQGYYFSKPLPANQFEEFLNQHQKQA